MIPPDSYIIVYGGLIGQGGLPPYSGVFMAASSVTGTGPGESNGLYKPQNNGSCGCTSPITEISKKPAKKFGCFRRYLSGSASAGYNQSSISVSEKSCF